MYDTLFSGVRIGNHAVKNRIAFCGPATGFAKNGKLTSRLAAYYLERTKGGAGFIEMEPDLTYQESCINEWTEFAEHIHTYGTKLIAAMKLPHHTGAMMKEQEIAQSIDIIYSAGFDGISFHIENDGAQSDLPGRFLQMTSQKYAGHFLAGICAPSLQTESCSAFIKLMRDSGADYIVLPHNDEPADRKADIPIVRSVPWSEPESCEKLLRDGGGDLIGLSEQLVCDPYWPVKASLGKVNEIRKHDTCTEDSEKPAGYISCMLNPYLGQESRYGENNMTPAAKSKNIVIIGGGPSGMQAAITASKRGHSVFLFEREDELGGQLKSSNYKEALNWLVGEMKRNQVDVRLGLSETSEYIAAMHPDIVVMAAEGGTTREEITSLLHKKGIQVVDISDECCSIGQAIKKGFYAAIDI